MPWEISPNPPPHAHKSTLGTAGTPHTNSHLVGPVPGASELTGERRTDTYHNLRMGDDGEQSDTYNDLCAARGGEKWGAVGFV